jgi:radical SAM superfamily enzyme YgiQ (UPF0313 family)
MIRYDEKSLVVLDHANEWVFAGDPEGRMEMIHTPEASFKRSRFNRWHRVQRDPWPGLIEIPENEIRGGLPDWIPAWKSALRDAPAKPAMLLQRWIDSFMEFHEQDAAVFRSLFRKIPILPPDAYRALYIRVQEGCPWNRCAFCSFYKDEHYRVIPQNELLEQIEALRAYWSSAARSRHGLFLGDANAVAVPAGALKEFLLFIREKFPEPELLEIHSFVDYFAGAKRSAEDWVLLRNAGLRRLSLGIESGDAQLMERVDKPACSSEIAQMVRDIGNAGISMNLIFLVGLGGRAWRASHYEKSRMLIESLALRRSDRVYLSPLVVDPERENWSGLNADELKNEITMWQSELKPVTRAQISPYHIRQFIY